MQYQCVRDIECLNLVWSDLESTHYGVKMDTERHGQGQWDACGHSL